MNNMPYGAFVMAGPEQELWVAETFKRLVIRYPKITPLDIFAAALETSVENLANIIITRATLDKVIMYLTVVYPSCIPGRAGNQFELMRQMGL